MPRIDFSLRKARYNPTALLPRFFENLDQTDGNYAYGIICDAWRDQWFGLYELINGIISPAHDSWYAGDTLAYIANLLGTPDLHAFPESARNFMVWCWPAIRGEKGVRRSVVALSALLGYKVEVIPLWSAFALPNPANLADSSNDSYLSEESALPLAIDGVPNPEVAAIRASNGLWVVNAPLQGGETKIPLYNHPAFTQPAIGFTVFFPDRLEPYYVVESDKTSMTLDKPLSVIPGNKAVPPGTNIPIFNPEIIYPASFYDLFIVTEAGEPDPSPIVAAFDDKLAVLTNAVIPFRDRLRRLLASYRASATVSLDCPLGLYGTSVTRSASANSRISHADALERARIAAYRLAAAELRCEPIPPVVEITGVEPLSARVFYSTFTYSATCPGEYYGTPVEVTVTRSSRVSQALADSLAYQAARNLANAQLECTRNIAPAILLSAPSPSYYALASVVARCGPGESGLGAIASGSGDSPSSYASAEAAALASAGARAQALLRCVPAAAPRLMVAEFRYHIEIGVTVTETCPETEGLYGVPITVSKRYAYSNAGTFRPTYAQAVSLAETAALAQARASIECFPNAGPLTVIGEPVTVYSAVATETVACPNGMNWRSGNVVTATATGTDSHSYQGALENASSGAHSAAVAALECAPPPFDPQSILLVARDEFGFDPELRLDSNSEPFNSGHDFYAHGVPLASARSDFSRFLAEDAPRLKERGIEEIVLEVNWFTALEQKTLIKPALSAEALARGVTAAGWTTLPVGRGIDRGGSTDDEAFKRAVLALARAGFKVGLSPLVRFLDTANAKFIDRHLVSYDEFDVLRSWTLSYKAFLEHYANLLAQTGVSPFLFSLGSGYRALTHAAELPLRRLFLRTLLEIRESLAKRWPETLLPYCARADEYGWDGELADFPLEGLWMGGVALGLNWAQPIGASPPALPSTSFFSPDLVPFFSTTYDNTAVELGMRFSVAVPGYVTGVSFYRGPLNTPTALTPRAHRGNLWDAEGNLIGSLEFGKELPEGWVSASFGSRHLIFPGQIYTISYHTFVGYYSLSTDYFTAAQTNDPITVPAKAGVYTYGADSRYPTSEVRNSNFWVDLVFVPQAGPTAIPATLSLARAGAVSGEAMYCAFGPLPEDNHLLSFSDHSGKAYSLSSSLHPAFGSKNLAAFLSSAYAHYLPPPQGYDGGAAPLSSNAYRDEFSFAGIRLVNRSGAATLLNRFNPFAPHSCGVQLAPANPLGLGLELKGGGGGIIPLPALLAQGAVKETTIEIDFKPDETGGSALVVLASVPDGPFTIEYASGYRQLRCRLALEGGQQYVSAGFGVAASEVHRLYLRYWLDSGNWQLQEGYYRQGVLVSNTYQLPGPLRLQSPAGLLYLGTRGEDIQEAFGGVLFRFKLAAKAANGEEYGGTFYFQEAYAGTRTGFQKVQALVSELGFPSVEGGLVDPESEVTAIAGGPFEAWPLWLDPEEAAYLAQVQANGYAFSDLRGPYGSNFRRSALHQIYGLSASLSALRAAGIDRVVAAEYDVRSPEAFMAIRNGTYVYPDGPLWCYRRTLNGKLAF